MGKAHSNAYCQAPHFYDLPYRIRRTLLCGRDAASLASMAQRWGWEETSTDWRSAIERKDIDAVDIALPNHLHGPAAIAAAEAGKIVLCEKPLALSLDEARAMEKAARGVPTLVWFNYRRVPAVAYARQLIDEGRLGTIFHYNAAYKQQWGADTSRPATWKMDPALAGSGVADDLLTHSLDTSLYLNGPITETVARARTLAPGRAVDDAVMALVMFENGSAGTFESTRFGIGCKNQNRFEIHGSGGMLRFDLERLNHLEFLDASNPSTEQGLRDILVTDLKSPIFPQLLAARSHHRLRAHVHRHARRIPAVPVARRVLPPELRGCPRGAAGARRGPAIGQDAAVDESRSIMNVTTSPGTLITGTLDDRRPAVGLDRDQPARSSGAVGARVRAPNPVPVEQRAVRLHRRLLQPRHDDGADPGRRADGPARHAFGPGADLRRLVAARCRARTGRRGRRGPRARARSSASSSFAS